MKRVDKKRPVTQKRIDMEKVRHLLADFDRTYGDRDVPDRLVRDVLSEEDPTKRRS